MKRWLIAVFVLCGSCYAQLSSGILDPSRSIDWTSAGVVGGIPSGSWTQCGSTIAAGSSAATINSAINACGANQYVLLAAGTYNITAPIVMKSNVVVRGSGSNSTLIVPANGVPGSGCGGEGGTFCFIDNLGYLVGTGGGNQANNALKPGGTNACAWTAGYSQGATSITLTSCGSDTIQTGQYIGLDQINDAVNSDLFVCDDTSTPCSLEGGAPGREDDGTDATKRSLIQIVKVTNISGSTYTISPGLYGIKWRTGQTPGAWWTHNGRTSGGIQNAGVENLSVDNSASAQDNTSALASFVNANNCWVKGVRSIQGMRNHVWTVQSTHITVQDSYFYGTSNAASESYGVESFVSSDNLILNNIFQHISNPVMLGNNTGSVYAYNFSIDDFINTPTFLSLQDNEHDAGVEYLLFEGNIGAGFYGDLFHGTGGVNTFFRNRWNGNECTGGTCNTGGNYGIRLDSYNRVENAIGNVLGTTGVHNSYVTGGTFPYIYNLGQGNTENSVTVPADSFVTSTLLRWGNYDTFTAAVRWCGNSSDTGWSTTCSSTSEIPTSIGTFQNAVPTKGDTGASQPAMPASFYFSSKPSFMGSKPWPLIGPDVTSGNVGVCSGGTYLFNMVTSNLCTGGSYTASAAGGHANSNPAMDCYLTTMGGPPDGTGSALAFNYSTCYSGASGPAFGYSPNPVAFGSVNDGTSSSPITVTITNTGSSGTLNIGTLGAPSDNEYVVSSNTCNGQNLAVNSTCTFAVTFTPTSAGSKPATISVPDNVGNPDTINLTGAGVATGPIVTLSCGVTPCVTVAYGNQTVGSTSTGQTVTLQNTGNATLTGPAGASLVANIATSNSQYAISSTTCGTTLTASSSCTVTVTFKPNASGAQNYSLTFTTNASTSPDSVALTGTGIFMSYVAATGCSTGSFGTSASNSFTFSCTAHAVNDAVVFNLFCHEISNIVPSSVTLTASGWTITKLVSLVPGLSGAGALFGAIVPNTSSTTFTATWSGVTNCNNTYVYIANEFAGNNPAGGVTTFPTVGSAGGSSGGCNQTSANVTPTSNNNAIESVCIDSPLNATAPYLEGATDGAGGDLSEYQLLSGGSGTAFTPAYGSTTGGYIVMGVAITPATFTPPGATFGTNIGIGSNIGWH